jgi:4-amino-4-deoxy-L-arabinose transferase-like glycosyltransferase
MLCKLPVPLLAVGIMVLDWSLLGRRQPASDGRRILLVAALTVLLCALWVGFMAAVTRLDYLRSLWDYVPARIVKPFHSTHRHGPGFYLGTLTADFGLWLLGLVPAAASLGQARRTGDARRARCLGFLFLWTAVVLAAFSVSVSKLQWYVYPLYPALALLVAHGAWRYRPRTRIARTALGLVLAGFVGARLARAVRTAAEDTKVIEMDRFARYARGLAGAEVWIDEALRPWVLFREWNYYYAARLPTRWVAPGSPPGPGSCVFLLTPRPEAFSTGGDPYAQSRVQLSRVTPEEASTFIVDLCRGRLPSDW